MILGKLTSMQFGNWGWKVFLIYLNRFENIISEGFQIFYLEWFSCLQIHIIVLLPNVNAHIQPLTYGLPFSIL